MQHPNTPKRTFTISVYTGFENRIKIEQTIKREYAADAVKVFFEKHRLGALYLPLRVESPGVWTVNAGGTGQRVWIKEIN